MFIGETPPNRLPYIKQTMDNITSSAFNVTSSGLGRFKRQTGDIWWLGVKRSEVLNEVYALLSRNLINFGFIKAYKNDRATVAKKANTHTQKPIVNVSLLS